MLSFFIVGAVLECLDGIYTPNDLPQKLFFPYRLSLCFYDTGNVFDASLKPEFSAFRLPVGS